jgi:peptidylprolyl isomerase
MPLQEFAATCSSFVLSAHAKRESGRMGEFPMIEVPVRLRPLGLLSAAAIAAIALAGCSAQDTEEPQATGAPVDLCDAAAESGDAVESVSVEGEQGAPATATFETPVEFEDVQRLVLEEGDGEPLETGEFVDYAMTAYDAASGDEIGEIGYEAGELLPTMVSPDSIFGELIGCAAPGSRIVAGLPAQQGTDAAAQIYVLDVLGVTPTAAWGEQQEPAEGMPTVELAEDGAPTVTVPDGMETPETTELSVLKEGDGVTVEEGDNVFLQYAGVQLSDGSEFDSSWSRGAPTSLRTTGVVEGFKKALEGQTVGSQVLAVIPPAEGYGGEDGHELQEETLVFVVDILGTQHMAQQEAPAEEAPAE